MDLYVVVGLDKLIEKLKDLAMRYGPDDAKVVLMIFFDVDCPACARMYKECGDYLQRLVREGKICIYYVDFPVHRGSEYAHVTLRRIYKNNPQAFLEVLRKVYMRQDDRDVIESLKDMNAKKEEIDVVMTCKKIGKEIGVRGTPTILIGIRSKNLGIVMEGYWGKGALEKLIERALNEDRELEKLITLLVLIGNVREYPPKTETKAETETAKRSETT